LVSENRLNFLDFRGLNLVDAHRALGRDVGEHARFLLKRRLDRMDEGRFQYMLRQGRACQAHLVQCHASSILAPVIKDAVAEYRACLEGWAEAAELGRVEHSLIKNRIDGQPVTELDLAFLLQHDNSGCQTGLYRQEDGGLILWHSEEDLVEGRFDKLRVAEFEIKGDNRLVQLHALIYPDLMPGPAFGWRSDNYVQAVDTLILRNPPPLESGVLVNCVAWLAWRLGPSLEGEEIVRALAPFFDGYALNRAYRREGHIVGEKCEFAGERFIPYDLPEVPGSYLFQANIFCNRRDRGLRAMEAMSLSDQRFFLHRLYRTRRWLRNKPQSTSPDEDIQAFYRLLGWRAGGEGGYANSVVIAHFLARLSSDGLNVWFGPGPTSESQG
jgi:hypothetical protein